MFVARNPHALKGSVIDTGHCLRHCQVVAGVPHSSKLRRGAKVLGHQPPLPEGVAIGTFNAAGNYTNSTDGSSHCALFLEETMEGSLRVVDAWVGRPIGERTIRNKLGVGPAVDDAARYYIVETA